MALKIDSLPVPQILKTLLISQGYVELYPPQEDAIKAGVLDGKSLLLTTPTASGKTLIAMLAAGKTVLEGRGKVIYLTPLRALANEKREEFKHLESLTKNGGGNVNVLISTGDYDSSGESLGKGDIIILTNEKFDSVLRHGVSWLDQVKLLVVDEVHLVGDTHRGPTIETILTKILTFSSSSQIVALSATITNSDDLAEWLSATAVKTEWRPVKLIEGVYEYGAIRFSDGDEKKVEPTNRGHPIDVAAHSLSEGGQALIFADTRRRAVSLALKASEVTSKFMSDDEKRKAVQMAKSIMTTGEATKLSQNLSRITSKGAAFHHAGLYSEHRRIVEDGFRNGSVKILTSTPTLAAGVNLPARRVVIASLMRYDSTYGGQTPISVMEYKQMCGRAGRPKFDNIGETVLISSSYIDSTELFDHYVHGTPEPVRSQLAEPSALRTHLLATISSIPGISETEISNFFSKTLFASQYRMATVQSKLSAAAEYLVDEGLVEKRGKRYFATKFGTRVSMLYIDPDTGVTFKRSLSTAEDGKRCSTGLLHLMVSCQDFFPKLPLRNKDWDVASEFLEQHMEEFFTPIPGNDNPDFYDGFMQDFRKLLVINSWINEWSEERIMDEYGVETGDLHRVVESADWLLYAIYEIAKLTGKMNILAETQELRQRARYGVKAELLPLTRLEGIGRVRARTLFRAGLTNISKLSKTTEKKLAKVPKIGSATAKKILEQLAH